MSIVSSGSVAAVNRGPDPLLLCLSSTGDYLKIFKTLPETLLLRKNLGVLSSKLLMGSTGD